VTIQKSAVLGHTGWLQPNYFPQLGHFGEQTTKIPGKYLGNFEKCSWRRMEKISWTDCARRRSIAYGHGGKEVPACSKRKEG